VNITFDLFPGGKIKALTMSYDDGTVDDRRLVEIFNRYGVRGTFHLNSGNVGKPGKVTPEEIPSLYAGHEVSAHSVSHPHLTSVPTESVAVEMLEDRKALEQWVGYPVKGMSYPYGSFNDEVVAILPALGIEYARTVKAHGNFSMPDDFLRWPATCHHRERLLEHAQNFVNHTKRGKMALLYVWGHSYEFDRNQNWELIEQFCQMVGNQDSIWYATNWEVMQYVKAVKSLQFTVLRDIVHNPSAISVWIGVGSEKVEIKPGETLKLG
jgi:peptidoglycan/xylan/chitin deacetylase (PgdA/CDA1 family)